MFIELAIVCKPCGSLEITVFINFGSLDVMAENAFLIIYIMCEYKSIIYQYV